MAGKVAKAYDVLTETDMVTRLRDRHRDYFLDLAEAAEPELRRAEQVAWLDILDENHDNMRAALDWSLSQGEVGKAARLAGALWRFWFLRGYGPEARQWLERVIVAGDAAAHTSVAFAKTLWSAAVMVALDWDNAAASLVERAEEMARGLGDANCLAESLIVRLGIYNGPRSRAIFRPPDDIVDMLAAVEPEVDEPSVQALVHWAVAGRGASPAGDEDTLYEVLQRYRELGDRWGQMWVLYFLSLGQGHWNVDTARMKEALAFAIELGSPLQISLFTDALCWRADLAGEYELATSTINYAVDTARRKGDVGLLGWMLSNRAFIEYEYGHLDEAKETLAELRRQAPKHDPWLEAWIAEEEGDHEAARHLADESVAMQRNAQIRPFRIAYALEQRGHLCLTQGDIAAARASFEECIVLARRYQEAPALRWGLSGLGQVEILEGDFPAAKALFEEMRTTHQGQSPLRTTEGAAYEPWWQILASNLLGLAARLAGDLDAARAHHRDAVRVAHEASYRTALTSALEFAAEYYTEAGDAARAARLLGSAHALRESISYPPPLWQRSRRDEAIAAARRALGDDSFERSFAEGAAMTIGDAVDLVVNVDA